MLGGEDCAPMTATSTMESPEVTLAAHRDAVTLLFAR
jgi:hypothetical protein